MIPRRCMACRRTRWRTREYVWLTIRLNVCRPCEAYARISGIDLDEYVMDLLLDPESDIV